MMLLQLILFTQILFILSTKHEHCESINAAEYRPLWFREGIWYDQLHIHSTESMPGTTASLFATNIPTNCGYYDLKVNPRIGMEFYKGYYAERFDDHFFPFMARIVSQNSIQMYLERRLCDHYEKINQMATTVDILLTDYQSFMILHQCIGNESYVMLLTHNKQFIGETNKIGIEHAIADIITQYNISLHNRMFIWSTRNGCRHHIEDIYPQFYRRRYIDHSYVECPMNKTIQTIELEDYWWRKEEMENERVRAVQKNINAGIFFVLTVISVLFFVYIFYSNFEVLRI